MHPARATSVRGAVPLTARRNQANLGQSSRAPELRTNRQIRSERQVARGGLPKPSTHRATAPRWAPRKKRVLLRTHSVAATRLAEISFAEASLVRAPLAMSMLAAALRAMPPMRARFANQSQLP
jgi:hypothetical protein